jgi:MinD-like ATPase involved in chromosome partitioning or flagellar assembly
MEKKLLIWSIKGGVGKTNIATELALRLDLPIITNEPYTTLSVIFDSKRLLQLKPNEKVPNFNHPMIFDFGGYIDNRIVDVIKQVDVILIPTIPEVTDIQMLIHTIMEIKEHNSNMAIIVNKYESEKDIESVQDVINKQFNNIPIFAIKKTRALPNIYVAKKSVKKMMEDSPLLNYSYKKVDKQFDEIVEFLNK